MSPDGQYLAAGCYDGNILVFHISSKTCVDRFVNRYRLVQLNKLPILPIFKLCSIHNWI